MNRVYKVEMDLTDKRTQETQEDNITKHTTVKPNKEASSKEMLKQLCKTKCKIQNVSSSR